MIMEWYMPYYFGKKIVVVHMLKLVNDGKIDVWYEHY